MESSIKYFCQVCERNLIVKWKCKDCLDTFRDNCRKINGNLSFTQSHTVTRLEDVCACTDHFWKDGHILLFGSWRCF